MIIKIVAIAVISAVISVVLRQIKPEFAGAVAIACSVLIIAMIRNDLFAVIDAIITYAGELGIESSYIMLLLKVIGIAYLTQFGASVCEDAGEKAIAMKVEFAGRITIILMSAPLMFAIINLITGILP